MTSVFFGLVDNAARAAKPSVGRACALVIHFRGSARSAGMTLTVTFGACVLLLQELPKCCQPLDVLTCY